MNEVQRDSLKYLRNINVAAINWPMSGNLQFSLAQIVLMLTKRMLKGLQELQMKPWWKHKRDF
jgi:hypothetical protein